jgi:arylsulfatase B
MLPLASIALVLCTAARGAAAAAPSTRAPNILFIVADDLG